MFKTFYSFALPRHCALRTSSYKYKQDIEVEHQQDIVSTFKDFILIVLVDALISIYHIFINNNFNNKNDLNMAVRREDIFL